MKFSVWTLSSGLYFVDSVDCCVDGIQIVFSPGHSGIEFILFGFIFTLPV